MSSHSTMSHILPQVIDGFKIEIDSDVVYSEYMNETNCISIEGNNLLDLKTDTFVVDLNQSLLPSKSGRIPLYCGEQKNIPEYSSSYKPSSKQNSVFNSGLRPSHYLHPQESHNKESQSNTIHHFQEGESNSKPTNSFYRICTNTMSPNVTMLDNNSFHHSQYSWDIQNLPLDLSIPKSLGDCSKPFKTETDESTKKENIISSYSDPGSQKDNNSKAVDDKTEVNSVPVHVVHRPIPTYPTLFHSLSMNNNRGHFSSVTNNPLPNQPWHDETWSQNLSRDPTLTVHWSCCDKYLWHNSLKDDEKHGASCDSVNKRFSGGYPNVYDSNSFSFPSSGLDKNSMPENSLSCALANQLPMNRSYQNVAHSVAFQPDLVDSRPQKHQYFTFDASKMSSDMLCRPTINSHRAPQALSSPTYHEPAVIHLDNEFMDSDHWTFTEKNCKMPMPRCVSASNEVSSLAHTNENVFKDKQQNVRILEHRSRVSPQQTPFKTNITNKSGKDCGNFLIFPPINKTIFRHNWTSMDNQGNDLTSMPIKRKRKRATGTSQVLDENKQPFEQTFNGKYIPKVKRDIQPPEEALGENGVPKVKLGNQPLEEVFNGKGITKEKRHGQLLEETFNDKGITTKEKRHSQLLEEVFNGKGITKEKRHGQLLEEAFNDKGITKVKHGNQPREETFTNTDITKVKQGNQPLEETFTDTDITKLKLGNQPLAEAFTDKDLPKEKQSNQHLNRCSIMEESKLETSHSNSHCSGYLPKTSHHKQEALSDRSEKLAASFECVTCNLKCDSLFALLEHQQKECQFVRKVYHATDCLGRVKEKDCQCTNCSLCKGVFNSKFRVFSHCLKGCYMRHSYCLENDSLQKLLLATTEESLCNNKDGNGSEESTTYRKKKRKISEDELNRSMEVLRAKYELCKGIEGKNKHDVKQSSEQLTEKCASDKNQGLLSSGMESTMLPQNVPIEKQTCDNHNAKLLPGEIKDSSKVDSLQPLETVNFGNITANGESEKVCNIKDASSRIKYELCHMGEALGESPESRTSEQGNEQTKNEATNSRPTARVNSLEVNQSIANRCKLPELNQDITLPDIKMEVGDSKLVASDKSTHENNFNHTEKNQQDNIVLQGLDEEHTTEISYDTRSRPTPVIKTEPTSEDFSLTCESQEKSIQSSLDRPRKVMNKLCHKRDVCVNNEWLDIRGDLGSSKGGVQEALPRLSFTRYDSGLQLDAKKTRRGRKCKSDVAGVAKGKRGSTSTATSSTQIPSAIAFGASQRINKNGEKEKITYLLDANSKPIMLVEKENKENSVLKCEKCLQCFPTFLFLTWHAKYTCPFRVTTGRRGRPRKSY